MEVVVDWRGHCDWDGEQIGVIMGVDGSSWLRSISWASVGVGVGVRNKQKRKKKKR